ncbi:MAG: hypothetical protein RIR70_2025 [Pseudomonadota bacterium]|jgi:hypothetical protein
MNTRPASRTFPNSAHEPLAAGTMLVLASGNGSNPDSEQAISASSAGNSLEGLEAEGGRSQARLDPSANAAKVTLLKAVFKPNDLQKIEKQKVGT